MAQRSKTERTTKFATTVDDLADAWVFVMSHLADVGDDPTINIRPLWQFDDDLNDASTRRFEVAVSGMTEEP